MFAFGCVVLLAAALAPWGTVHNWLRSPVLIGFAGQLSGQGSDLGVHGRNGAQLAVEHINEAGGVRGLRLELLAKDDGGTPEGALTAAKALLNAGVLAIVGHMTSSQTMASLPLMNERRVVLFSPTSSTPLLSGLDDWFFRNQPATDIAAAMLAEHAEYAGQGSARSRLGLVYDPSNASYSQPYVAAFTTRLQQIGGHLAMLRSVNFKEPEDLLAMLAEIDQAGIQTLVIIASARDTASLAQLVTRLDPPMRLLTSDWAYTDTLLRYGGPCVEGLTMTATFEADEQSPAYAAFQKSFFERFGSLPTFAAARSYEAVLILAEALRRCGASRQDLPEALRSIRDFPTLSGSVSLDRFGDVESRAMLVRVQDGRFVRVEPDAAAANPR